MSDVAPSTDEDSVAADPSQPDVYGVLADHRDAIERADEPKDTVDAMKPVLEEMATGVVVNDEDADLWVEQLDAIQDTLTKTSLRKQLEKAVTKKRAELETPLDTWLEETVSRVIVYVSTDVNADTQYRWELVDGHGLRADSFTTTGRTHNKWQALRDVIFDTFVIDITQPGPADHREWPGWVQSFIVDRQDVREVPGPRTQAVEWLADSIRTSPAFPDLEAVAPHGRAVWMDDLDATEVRVPSKHIRSVIDQFDITWQDLHAQLDDDGYLVGGSRPHRYSDGRQIRVWHLSTDLAEPEDWYADVQELHSTRHDQ